VAPVTTAPPTTAPPAATTGPAAYAAGAAATATGAAATATGAAATAFTTGLAAHPIARARTPHARSCSAGPIHAVEHWLPLIQDRLRACFPMPHETEHKLQRVHNDHLEGTIGIPHATVFVSGPTQGLPHALPAIQARLLTFTPFPHTVEQALNGPNAVHFE